MDVKDNRKPAESCYGCQKCCICRDGVLGKGCDGSLSGQLIYLLLLYYELLFYIINYCSFIRLLNFAGHSTTGCILLNIC